MLLIGMFQLRGVNDGVVRPDEREGYGDDGRDSYGGTQGGPDSTISKLGTIGQHNQFTTSKGCIRDGSILAA